MKKIIIVTGCAGFIGSHTAEALLKRGDIVLGIDNINSYYDIKQKEANLKILKKYPQFRFFKLTLGDPKNIMELTSIFEKYKPTHIAHLAARAGVRPSIEKPLIYVNSNINGTLLLLELAKDFKINNIVLASSSSVFGNRSKVPFKETDSVDTPISMYAATKRAVELLAYTYHHTYNMNITCIRPFTVYGPRGRPDMAPYLFMDAIATGKPIKKFGDGSSKRDYTYVGDFVKGFIAALDIPRPFEIINLGHSEPVTLNEFISTIEEIIGKTAKINQLPKQIGDVDITFADTTKAKKLLKYNPSTSLKKGLTEQWNWFKEFKKIK